MLPSKAIAKLDRLITKHGQTIALRRAVANAPAIEATVRGSMRGYRPEEITDGIAVGSSQVILSPTVLKGTPFEDESNWPRKNDKVVINGRVRNIEAPDPVKIDDVLVRLNLTVAG
ncbi:hypothetical protein [Aliihoeflea sp. PC F10.4]